MDKVLIIMQGVPGSGKSHLATSITQDYRLSEFDYTATLIASTDEYWVNNPEREYAFDGSKLGEAHAWNQARVEDAMTRQWAVPVIVVDNTNVLYRHAKPYFELADKHGYQVQVIRVDPGLKECLRRNAERPENRRVPEVTVHKMYTQMENLWQQRQADIASSIGFVKLS